MSVVVRFKFFRTFFVLGALVNGGALFFFKPFVSYLVAFLTLVFIVASIR